MIHHGDCLEVMASMEPESVSAVVTDPPYGLGFMGKAWDGTAGPGGLGDMPMRRRGETNKVNTGVSRQGGRQRSTEDFAKRQARDARSFQAWCETWATACFRVAKPGAHLLAFGGTRTAHRLTAGLEDAGWEIRDCLVWAYASGFPKSHNLSGDWQGWGTALKPAWEPIILARKPLRGTVATNVATVGTGALNIDGTRLPTTEAERDWMEATAHPNGPTVGWGGNLGRDGHRTKATFEAPKGGRWPANVILTDPIFDGNVPGVVGGGETTSGLMKPTRVNGGDRTVFGQDALAGYTTIETYGDTGTYSRFFLIPKADRAEREPVGLRSFDQSRETAHRRTGDMDTPYLRGETMRRNTHPTVKPVDLMRHLVRLVTPPGGIVLDPFLGSGTTGIAAEMEGFDWIGIEKEAEYVAIAQARLEGVQRGFGLSA